MQFTLRQLFVVVTLAALCLSSALWAGWLGAFVSFNLVSLASIVAAARSGATWRLPAVLLGVGLVATVGGVIVFDRYFCLGTFDYGGGPDTTPVAMLGLVGAGIGISCILAASVVVVVRALCVGRG